ncbi:MAG: energy-coupling factor transporter transmembrane protein EcfT [Lachnospiraceae bacterium]|nr:energy-coupling factor transporter transmembrane protein EcfT [Lachnospiraceae bacterium]
MIRDITLGQYYEADSVIHKLDPRVKLLFTVLFIVTLYVGRGILCFVLAASFLTVVIVLSKVPVSFMLRGLRSIVILLIISALLNLFLTEGEAVVQFWVFRITKEGIRLAALMMVRLVMLIMGTSILTLTTTPAELTDGLEKTFSFLKVIHVPVHAVAMMMSIALRFIPILIEEVNKIMKAQQARGADFENGGLIKKAKSMIPLLIPLFYSAFRRADELADAMEARCYHGGDDRTKLHPLKHERRDYVAYFIQAAYLAGIILLRIFLSWFPVEFF